MSRFADLSRAERGEAIEEAAARFGSLPVIVEKDFWVCWLLGRIFESAEIGPHVVFKGGTSLSKVFAAIQRFSEDIDLAVSPALLGQAEADLDAAPSPSARLKRVQRLEKDCAALVEGAFRLRLEEAVRAGLGAPSGDTVWIVTVRRGGFLFLLGRLRVAEVTGPAGASQRLGEGSLWDAKHHILPFDGQAEPLRELDLAGLAPELRFESDRDRLKLRDGRVNAQQLQSLRRLTSEAAALLRSLWEQERDIADALADIDPSGAGFGASASNRNVERKAVDHVKARLETEGWSVESWESRRVGFDLLCRRQEECRHVEVKGIRGSTFSFFITEGELRLAKQDPKFWLVVVTQALEADPKTHEFSGKESLERFRFVPVAHRAFPA